MPRPAIYFVGKPDHDAHSINLIHQAGFDAGILADMGASPKYLDLFDHVVPVDFAQIDTELPRLKTLGHKVAGLLCTYENYLIAKGKIGEYLNLPTISTKSAYNCTDKYLMRQAFAVYSPALSPRFTVINDDQSLLDFARSASYPLIIKPTNLVKSILVLKCDNEEQLIDNYRYATAKISQLYAKYRIYNRTPQLIVEEFITGQMYSIAAYIDHSGEPHFCDGVVKLTTAQQHGVDDNYLYTRSIPSELDSSLLAALFDTARAGIKALNMTSSPAHIELIVNDKGVKIIEIGARTGGYRPRMYALSYGVDTAQCEIDIALKHIPNTTGNFKQYTAVYELFPDAVGSFVRIQGINPRYPLHYFSLKVPAGQVVGPAKDGYKATAVAIITNPSKEAFDATCAYMDTLSIVVDQ